MLRIRIEMIENYTEMHIQSICGSIGCTMFRAARHVESLLSCNLLWPSESNAKRCINNDIYFYFQLKFLFFSFSILRISINIPIIWFTRLDSLTTYLLLMFKFCPNNQAKWSRSFTCASAPSFRKNKIEEVEKSLPREHKRQKIVQAKILHTFV